MLKDLSSFSLLLLSLREKVLYFFILAIVFISLAIVYAFTYIYILKIRINPSNCKSKCPTVLSVESSLVTACSAETVLSE